MSRTLICLVVLLSAAASQAAVIVTTVNETGAIGFTPSAAFNVPANDVLLNRTPSPSSGDFTLEGSGGTPVMTDGTYGAEGHGIFGTGGDNATAGQSVTYTLTGSATGYDISSIITLGGWNDNGRDQQKYNVYYSTVAAPGTFIQIGGTVDYNPSNITTASATKVTISDNSSALLASGVGALRFDFGGANGPSSGVENGYTGYAELIGVGVATVPEPATAVLFGVAVGLFLAVGAVRRVGSLSS